MENIYILKNFFLLFSYFSLFSMWKIEKISSASLLFHTNDVAYGVQKGSKWEYLWHEKKVVFGAFEEENKDIKYLQRMGDNVRWKNVNKMLFSLSPFKPKCWV